MNNVLIFCFIGFFYAALGYINPVLSTRDAPDPGVVWDGCDQFASHHF
jgi:hypothetical protein